MSIEKYRDRMDEHGGETRQLQIRQENDAAGGTDNNELGGLGDWSRLKDRGEGVREGGQWRWEIDSRVD